METSEYTVETSHLTAAHSFSDGLWRVPLTVGGVFRVSAATSNTLLISVVDLYSIGAQFAGKLQSAYSRFVELQHNMCCNSTRCRFVVELLSVSI